MEHKIKIDYKEFETSLIAEVKKQLEESSGGKVSIKTTLKRGRMGVSFDFKDTSFEDEVFKGIMNGKPEPANRIFVILYLDDVYREHAPLCEGDIPAVALDFIKELYDGLKINADEEFLKSHNIFMDAMPRDKEELLKRVECCFLNKEANKDTFEFAAAKEWHDIAYFYTVTLGDRSMYVTKAHLHAFGITLDELHEAALSNTLKRGIALRPLNNLLESLLSEEGVSFEEAGVAPPPEDLPFPLVCGFKNTNLPGAVVFTLPGVVELIKEKVGETFYVVPTSRYEAMIHSGGDASFKEFLNPEFFEDFNSSFPVDDRLTNQVYYYNGEEFVPVFENPVPIF